MFVSIEGIDGAGKTVISKLLAEKLNYSYTGQKELAKYLNIDEQTYLKYCASYKKKVNYDRVKIFMFYTLSCYLVSSSNEDIICDRHFPTVYFWYGNEECLEIANMIYVASKKPDITFILEVSKETALKRTEEKMLNGILSKTEYLEDKKKAEHAPEFVPKVVKYLEYFNLKYKIIDGNKSLTEVVNDIMSYL